MDTLLSAVNHIVSDCLLPLPSLDKRLRHLPRPTDLPTDRPTDLTYLESDHAIATELIGEALQHRIRHGKGGQSSAGRR